MKVDNPWQSEGLVSDVAANQMDCTPVVVTTAQGKTNFDSFSTIVTSPSVDETNNFGKVSANIGPDESKATKIKKRLHLKFH
uniref:Uncharacterized protein n=1 Tax=Ciona intestinalis TaxID=7719 RepID=H2XZU4_CIOIN